MVFRVISLTIFSPVSKGSVQAKALTQGLFLIALSPVVNPVANPKVLEIQSSG